MKDISIILTQLNATYRQCTRPVGGRAPLTSTIKRLLGNRTIALGLYLISKLPFGLSVVDPYSIAQNQKPSKSLSWPKALT